MKHSPPLLSTVLALTLSIGAHGQEPAVHQLTLEEAFTRALAANPGVEGARTGIELADARRAIAFSYLLPRIGLNGDYTLNDDQVSFGGEDDGVVILPERDWSYALTLRQPIFAGARDLRTYRQAKLGIEGAREGLRGTSNLVLLQVGVQYLAVLQADALIEIEEMSAKLASNRLSQATDFYEVGEVTQVDVLRAQASITASKRRLTEAKQLRQSAVGQLRVALALDGPIKVERPANLLPPLSSEAELIALAMSSSPAIRGADLGFEAAGLEVKKQKGAYLPIIWANGGWIRQKSGFPTDEYGFLALNVSVPLFQGGEVRARVREAREGERLAEIRREDLRRSVTEDVRTALLEVETAKTVLALSQEELEAATKEYSEVTELYSAQETTSLDVEASELNLIRAKRTVVTSQVGVAVSNLRVYYLVGTLAETILGHAIEEDKP